MGMGRAGDAENGPLLPPTLHLPLTSEISSLPALPTSILAPENGFSLTQMIKSKLQQHHPATLTCSSDPS